MRQLWWTLQIVVFVAWIALAMSEAMGIAVLGTEETRLEMQMGADNARQQELSIDMNRMRADLDRHMQPVALQNAVTRLQLPLEKPTHYLARSSQPPE